MAAAARAAARVVRFPCDTCSKTFSKACTLKTHKRAVHERLRRFACGECGKAFLYRAHMVEHRAMLHKR